MNSLISYIINKFDNNIELECNDCYILTKKYKTNIVYIYPIENIWKDIQWYGDHEIPICDAMFGYRHKYILKYNNRYFKLIYSEYNNSEYCTPCEISFVEISKSDIPKNKL